jgi:hypothetical protein
MFIVGGTILAMVVSLSIIDPSLIGSTDITIEPLSPLFSVPFLVGTMSVGFVAGLALWIRTMRRFCSRAQLQQYLTRPYIPMISELMEQIFDSVYDRVHVPYRLEE